MRSKTSGKTLKKFSAITVAKDRDGKRDGIVDLDPQEVGMLLLLKYDVSQTP